MTRPPAFPDPAPDLHGRFPGENGRAKRLVRAAAAFAQKTAAAALFAVALAGPGSADISEERAVAAKIIETAQLRWGKTFPPEAHHAGSVEEALTYLDADSRVIPAKRPPEETNLEGGIAYVRPGVFDGRTGKALRSLESWRRKKMTGLIVDLRGNPGGDLTEALRWLRTLNPPRTPPVWFAKLNGSVTPHATAGRDPGTYPIVLLVDSETASSAELLAVYLRRYRKAKTVGTAMRGKQTIQELLPLDPQRVLLLTVGRYEVDTAPSWKPDFIVTGAEEQIAKARQLLKDPAAQRD